MLQAAGIGEFGSVKAAAAGSGHTLGRWTPLDGRADVFEARCASPLCYLVVRASAETRLPAGIAFAECPTAPMGPLPPQECSM